MTTMAEQWIAEGRIEGEAKGRIEGEAKGRIEGSRMILLKLLAAKFGELPEQTRQRVQTAPEEALLRWTTRLLEADSLESVFSD
jgi:hypothetical protein